MDLNAHRRRQSIKLNAVTFYGQLLRIFCFTVAASEELSLQHSEILILVEILPCKILTRHSSLDIHFYKTYGTPLVFDVTCVQCLVGRVKADDNNGDWAIIDRSGSLVQAYYAEDGPEDEENHVY